MARLYARIAFGVVVAVVTGWIASSVFLSQMRGPFEQGLRDQVLGGGLGWVGSRLDAMPREQWNDGLAEARRAVSIPLAIVDADRLPRDVAPRVSRAEPVIAGRPEALTIYMPLHGGVSYLVAGPLSPPPYGLFLAAGLVFALVLTATASVAVGLPLVRRLRSLRHAILELGGGNWAMRLDANAEGALSELAESINRMAAQLQQQFREREALLQTVSHEIGTPLSRMRFQIELLEGEMIPPEPRSRLRALSTDLDELDELSTELVAWMESEAHGQMKQRFDVAPVLESLVELECHRSEDPVRVELAVPAGLTLQADQRQFQRAIENLLRNALRYAHKRIVVAAYESGGSVFVDVRDDGPGIAADQRARVLEPFVRIEGPRSRAHRGLGLGLAIVRRIVDAHGGTVTVADALEGGTRVQTSWPDPSSRRISSVPTADSQHTYR